jgi:hypothetical protein
LGPKTGTWRDAGYSENMSFGPGVASGAWRGVGRDLGTFTVFRPDHWAFSGTELRRGDRFGHAADERLLSYETNGVDYILDNRGNPVPTGSDGTPINYLVLALEDSPSWATPGNAAMGIFTSPRSGGMYSMQRRPTGPGALKFACPVGIFCGPWQQRSLTT